MYVKKITAGIQSVHRHVPNLKRPAPEGLANVS